MRILYLGDDQPLLTSAQRSAALRRLGHVVTVLNPRAALPPGRVVGGVSTRLGFWPFVPWINSMLRRRIGSASFDLAWVDCGPELSPGFHRWLRHRGVKILNYNVDDPFGSRDGRKWDLYRRAVRFHDLTVVVRKENVEEARSVGARKVLHVLRSYDPVAHAPLELKEVERAQWTTEVIFVGSWMPERGPFIVHLLETGVPLTIRGDHWQKAREYQRLRSVIRGPAVYGADYVKAIQCSQVALGLLSKGNRDLHTTRSAEIPFIGGAVFCAERTSEHEAMFRDRGEALFWSSPQECARCCQEAMASPQWRMQMVLAARQRACQLGLSNDTTLTRILDVLVEERSAQGGASFGN